MDPTLIIESNSDAFTSSNSDMNAKSQQHDINACPQDQETTQDIEDTQDEAIHEISLLYDEAVGKHCTNDEELNVRCALIYSKLQESKVLESKKLSHVSFAQIPIEYLQRLHTDSYIEKVMSAEKYDDETISQMFAIDTYENKFTPECARLAAGGALEGMKEVVTSPAPVKSAFCLVRPPGHHALAYDANGFCFFNNAALAAHFAKEMFGLTRVCILDWDVHHGDGTQDLFYESKDVLFISVHRHENAVYFPYRETGNHTYVGEKDGEGFNVNVAWNTVPSKDDETQVSEKEYKFLFENLLFGILKEFDPQLLILSAGFDSAKGDPLGKQQVAHDTYHWLSQNLQKICPKILMVLEGGYSMETLTSCATISVKALMGYSNDFLFNDVSKSDLLPAAFDCMLNTARAHCKYWKAAQEFVDKFSDEQVEPS